LASVILISLLACGQTTRLTDNVYPAYPEDHPIEVFTVRPERAFIEVAIVNESSEFTANRQKLLASLKRQAREVGADAIIFSGFGAKTTSGPTTASTNPVTGVTTYNSSTSTINSAEALAIRWVTP